MMWYAYSMQLVLDIEHYETVSPQLADRVLRELARLRNRDDYRIDTWLLSGFELGVEQLYGYASFAEYVGRLFDIGARGVEDRVRTARQLQDLPLIREARRRGEMKYTTARELTRVATAQTEQEWMRQAEGKSSRQIRRMVAGRRRGDTPATPAPAEAQVEDVVFREVAPHARARLEEARAQVMKYEGGRIDDGELLARMAEALLAAGEARSSSDAGAAPYRKVIHQCADCGRAEWEAAGSVIGASEVDAAVASCDAQVVDLSAKPKKRATQTIPPSVRRAVVHRQKGRCAVPGCENRIWGDCHHLRPRAEGGTHDPDNLVYVCPAHHRAAHEGRLVIRGSWSERLRFEHADGTAYGSPHARADRAELLASVCEALTGMGFRRRDAQGLIDAARPRVQDGDGFEQVLRYALAAVPAPTATVRESIAPYVRVDRAHARAA